MEHKTTLDIPSPFDRVFSHYAHFNAIQSSLLDVLLNSDRPVVLSAPTGSGKTVAFELAMVRLLRFGNKAPDAPNNVITLKAVYIAPIKALCAEKFHDWNTRFGALGVNCVLVTGDSDIADLSSALRAAQLVITTPEKWDSMTRHWRDCHEVLSAVRLFMVDEVHLLNENVRGPILEVIVARMRTIVAALKLRFVVVSATIPNIGDLSAWIAAVSGVQVADVEQLIYKDSQRPVPLEKHILGIKSQLHGFKFDLSLNYRLCGLLRRYSEWKATLIFCNSRKSAEMAAAILERENGAHFPLSDQQKSALTQLSQNLMDSKLPKLIAHGIAFHHAGLSLSDRHLIEEHFRTGNIMVLCCTNTLSMGVNLPAHLVVVKSTEAYHAGALTEYSESTVLQMMGRAGRTEQDDKGVAVILTHSRNVRKYENLMNGRTPIESHLHKHLAEHLNSEIALQTITSLDMAMNWLRLTYLYVRAVRNPKHYGFTEHMDRDLIERQLEEMCLLQMNALHSAGLVAQNSNSELDVQPTSYGKLMAKFYLCFDTMKLFRQLHGNETLFEVFQMIVQSKEFGDFTLRVNEKKVLNELNAYPLRFPIRGRIKSQEDKVSCLLQSVLGNIAINSPGLAQESLKVLRIGERVAKCLLEYLRLACAQLNEFRSGCYQALLNNVTLAKCFHAKLWENSAYAAKQLQKIGATYSAMLANAGKTTLKSIAETGARTIEQLLKKSPPFGDEVLQQLSTFPEYEVQLSVESGSMLRICVRQINESYVFDGASAVVIVGDTANNLLLFKENVDSILLEYGVFTQTIKMPNVAVEQINAHIIHPTLVGVDVNVALVLNVRPQNENINNTIINSTSPKVRKRQHQTTLNFEAIKRLKTDTDGCLPAATTIGNYSATNEQCTPLNLKSFCFFKRKIQQAGNKTGPETRLPEADNPNQSVLVQRKLTEYFGERKFNKSTDDDDEIKKHFEESMITENDDTEMDISVSQEGDQKKENLLMPNYARNMPKEQEKTTCFNPISAKNFSLAKPILEIERKRKAQEESSTSLSSSNLNDSTTQLKKPLNLRQDALENKKSIFDDTEPTDIRENLWENSLMFTDQDYVLNLSRAAEIRLEKVTSNEDKRWDLHSSMSIDNPSQVSTQCASEQTLAFWYNVAQTFAHLKAEMQDFKNFHMIYYKSRSAHQKTVEYITAQLHHSTISETCKLYAPNNNNQSHADRSSSGNDDSNVNGGSEIVLNLCCRDNPKPKQSTQKQNTKQRQQQQHVATSVNNPFRLQIYKHDIPVDLHTGREGEQLEKVKRIAVENINREVMEMVLKMKYEEQTLPSNPNQLESIASLEHELLLNNADNSAPMMTFDEYLRHFMQDHMKTQ